jgi:hypothetical protein
MRIWIISVLLVLLSIHGGVSVAANDFFVIETEGSYRIADADSVDVAKKMALFIAKRKAVDLAGRYLSYKSLIKVYEQSRDGIFSLAAREIEAEIIEQSRQTVEKSVTFRVRIRTRVRVSDFVKAEMEDAKQEKKEAKQSFHDEMEQPVSAEIDPGKDIAKAYRLLRKKQWRMAMIYLNHLLGKYPNWDSLYMVKAATLYILHEPVLMKKALTQACELENQTACDDLKSLKRLHGHDFGLSVID